MLLEKAQFLEDHAAGDGIGRGVLRSDADLDRFSPGLFGKPRQPCARSTPRYDAGVIANSGSRLHCRSAGVLNSTA
jgi:hypothetical protein